MPSNKKYKLFSMSSDGGKALCAFFTSPAGCKNGDNCKFLHEAPGKGASAVEAESFSVVSSEENDVVVKVEEPDMFASPSQAAKQSTPKKNKKKRKSTSGGDDIFANPKEKNAPQKKSKTSEPAPPPAVAPSTQSITNKSSQKKQEAEAFDFRSLLPKLPVASFSIPGVTTPTTPKTATPKPTQKSEAKPSPAPSKQPPLPTSSERGRPWVPVVKATRDHDRFSGSYDFAKYKEATAVSGTPAEWIKARPFGAFCKANPQAIAIDCEMCETQDPLSGAKNGKALCRVSIVNAENPDEVLLDTLVRPSWPVIDYRTRINGITKEDLDGVEFTLRHAQAFMMALCSEETVIVGHAVHNDLVALRMEHHCVADSAFLFQAKDSTSAAVSLKDLVKAIFKSDMPNTHDSVNDARKALDCVRHWAEKGGDVEAIQRSSKNKSDQLFLHRIPKQCTKEHLLKMFVSHTSIQPTAIDDIEFSGDLGKTHVSFKSSRHANLAFESIEGSADEDKSGRLQKKVYLRNNDYVRVRKMVHENRGSSTPAKSSK